MDLSDQVIEFGNFFSKYYNKEIMDCLNNDYHTIEVDFEKLAMFNIKLSESLLDDPEATLKASELSIQNMGLPPNVEKVQVRFSNLPESCFVKINHVRTKHLAKLLKFRGIIKAKSEIRPKCVSANFECPSCGAIIDVAQVEKKFLEPQMCSSCGRKGKFKLMDKKLIDAQVLDLEESHEDMTGSSEPKRLKMILFHDLVSPMSDKRTNPGTKLEVVGELKEIPIEGKSGAKTVNYDLLIEGNNFLSLSEDFDDLEVTPEEEEKIKELSKDPEILDYMTSSITPTIYGYEKIKLALILQLFGGSRKVRPDGVSTRGDMHMLLIGDPGAGKSQIMKRMSVVAPKSKFVSGKGTSGAGLTASVIRDEMTGSWSLEAGALVLANKGFCMIDEMDKMTTEDRSAMHEALEQQCYHHDTIIQKADGSEFKIGEFIDDLFDKYPERIIEGHKCQILPTQDLDFEMLTTNWREIFKTKIDRVSRHLPEDHFIKINMKHGRSVVVTPEHPVFVFKNGKIETIRADQVSTGDWCPIPLEIPISGKKQIFEFDTPVYNSRAQVHINVPASNCESFYKILGYFISEGSVEKNRGKLIGINFTNKDENLLDDFENSMKQVFNLPVYRQMRKDNHDPRWMSRYTSTELITFLKQQVPEILTGSKQKQIPQLAMKAKMHDIAIMLSCLFEGDGHASSKKRTIRIGYSTISKRLAEQVQDLLLRFKIRSSLTIHDTLFKVSITGYDNIFRFDQHIGFRSKRKNSIVKVYLETNDTTHIRSKKDLIPTVYPILINLLENYNIKAVGKYTIASMKHDLKKSDKQINRKKLIEAINLLKSQELSDLDKHLVEQLSIWTDSDIGFEKVKSVEKYIDDSKWTYDVTIEPNHTFISQNMVLHNTITVSKANIQATLNCQTTVLAAANPKFGRFDPYAPINDQIDLPPALISRFDLIFPIKDVPDQHKDAMLADFILDLHQRNDYDEPPIPTELLTKYIAYARKTCVPKLSSEALTRIKKYYVDMRSSGVSEDGSVRGVSITTRQLEGLIRLAEASAKIRLSETVELSDADRAIELLSFCLSEIAMDKETGKIDIDIINSVGVSATQRSKISNVNQVIKELEEEVGKLIPMEDIIKKCTAMGTSTEEVEEALEKLKRSGDLFEPKRGFYQRL